jgi:hydroxymethylpyrimidine kinase/phosphomethylpyrimidine kinase
MICGVPPPVVMTIAGSDPSGSSGLQADLPTIAALGAHGTSVVTVVTAQDSQGVKAFHELPLELIRSQIECLIGDLPPVATKTGLLWTTSVVEAVAEHARAGRLGSLVVDPVLVDSTGMPMVGDDTVAAYRHLAGSAVALTPNRWEAELLTGVPFVSGRYEAAAEALLAFGCDLVVVTGGRGEAGRVCDVAITGRGVTELCGDRVGSGPIRGTGCTFSAALATYVAWGEEPLEAAQRAREVVQVQLRRTTALNLGSGRPGVPHSAPGAPE